MLNIEVKCLVHALLYKDINFLCSVSLHMHQSHMALSSPRLDPGLGVLVGAD